MKIFLDGPPLKGKTNGTWHESHLGKGALKGTLKIPITKLTFTTKGGSFSTIAGTSDCKNNTLVGTHFTGSWRVTKATGKLFLSA